MKRGCRIISGHPRLSDYASRLFVQFGFYVVCCLFKQFGRAAERNADIALALASEDSARGEEYVALLHYLVRESEAVALEILGNLCPYEETGLSLAVAAAESVEQLVCLLSKDCGPRSHLESVHVVPDFESYVMIKAACYGENLWS